MRVSSAQLTHCGQQHTPSKFVTVATCIVQHPADGHTPEGRAATCHYTPRRRMSVRTLPLATPRPTLREPLASLPIRRPASAPRLRESARCAACGLAAAARVCVRVRCDAVCASVRPSRPCRATKLRERRGPARVTSASRLVCTFKSAPARLCFVSTSLRVRRLRDPRSRVCVSRWSPCAVAALWQASTLLEGARSAVSVFGVTSRAVGGRPVAALQQLVSDMGVCSSWCGAQSVVFLALRAPS